MNKTRNVKDVRFLSKLPTRNERWTENVACGNTKNVSLVLVKHLIQVYDEGIEG